MHSSLKVSNIMYCTQWYNKIYKNKFSLFTSHRPFIDICTRNSSTGRLWSLPLRRDGCRARLKLWV